MDKESVTSRASYARFQIGVENRDYHHLSQSETIPSRLDTSRQPDNIPTGIRVKSLQKKSEREKISDKKISVADGHYFSAGSKTGTPAPSPRSVGPIRALAEVLALSQRAEAVLSIHLSIRLFVHPVG
jgi:hypothetical protein